MASLKKKMKEEEELKSTWVYGPIVVGAGPSGLAVAACLSANGGVPCVVLEKNDCIASLWKYRTYDRLNLQLPLMGFPEDFPKYPTKDQFISYMESYAEKFSIKPKFNQYVNKAEFDSVFRSIDRKMSIHKSHLVTITFSDTSDQILNMRKSSSDRSSGLSHVENLIIGVSLQMRFVYAHFLISLMIPRVLRSVTFWAKRRVRTQDVEYMTKWLIVATGENAEPVSPQVSGITKFQGRMIHSSDYKSGALFKNQKVLVVGCGNSGMEVSLDLCSHNASPHMVVRNTVHVLPRQMFGFSIIGIAMALLKWFPLRLVDKVLLLVAYCSLGNTDRLGLRRPKTGPIELKNTTGKTPVLDVGALSKIKSGKIKVMDGVREITKTGAKFIDGEEVKFDSIILATGYKTMSLLGSSRDFFTNEGMPKTPFPNGWKGEQGLYSVGFTRRGLLGTASEAVNVSKDISEQWCSRAGQ